MKTPKDIEVTSWTDLIERLYADTWKPAIKTYRSDYAFRGLSDKNYDLRTSLIRHESPDLEFHLIRNFKKYARIDDSADYTIWNWLAIAQHHWLPTRLLDWTYSPFAAMHFATANSAKYDVDGAIWCADFVKIQKLLPDILKEELEREGSHVFTVELLSTVSKTLQDFDSISEEDFVLFFEPPSMDDRIVNQFALHSVISNPKAILNEILIEHPELYQRLIIPRNLKWEIRDKLDQANINERVLFPGLDGLSRWLARYYGPR